MQDFKNLIAWQKSHDFVKEIYLHSSAFPSYELYGLTSQLRRAAMSIPANLAEGASRGSKADFARFVQILWVLPLKLNICCSWHLNLDIFQVKYLRICQRK